MFLSKVENVKETFDQRWEILMNILELFAKKFRANIV